MILLSILVCITVALLAILFIPMQFGVRYEKSETVNKIYVYVSLFGILIRIPVRDHNKPRKKRKERKTKEKKVATRKEFSFDAFRRNVDKLSEVYQVSKNELSDILTFVREHLTCKNVDFSIRFGFDDAAKTGIGTGAVWTSGTLLLKIIDSLIGIKKINMNVYPDFNEKVFNLSFKTILIIQPIHFIIIVRKVKNAVKFIKHKINQM